MSIDLNDQELQVLRGGYDYESSMGPDEFSLGWHWYDISAPTHVINKLIFRGLIRLSFKSNRDTRYRLTDAGKALFIDSAQVIKGEPIEQPVSVEGMFSDIVGYDDVKELLVESLQLESPIHVLLHSPPALAKTMFLWDIERTFGEQAMPLLGSATSHAGLWDMIADVRPKILLVDELDKMTLADQASLLSLMETGRIIRAKVGRRLDVKLKVWVVAAANRIDKFPAELLSRFCKFKLEEYTTEEFRKVVTNVLVSREDTDKETASEIAVRLVGKTHDVRDAVRVARLSKRTGVRKAVELLIR